MAIQTIPGGLWLPRLYPRYNVPATKTYTTMSDAGGKVAALIHAPKTGNIRKVVWATGNVGTGATVDVRLETVDLTTTPARPSGTLFGTTTNGAQVVASSDDNVVFATSLTADAAVTQGDLLAIVIANAAPGNMAISCISTDQNEASGFPFMRDYDGANWIDRNSYAPMFALEYSDGTYAPIMGVYPTTNNINYLTLNTGTSPDVAGLLFQLPFPCRVRGAWASFWADGNYTVKLVSTAYNQGAGTGILASSTMDKDQVGLIPNTIAVTFNTSVELDAATNYRLLIEPSSATSVYVYYAAFGSLALMDAWEGGSAFCLTTAKDPTGNASWTDYNSGTFRHAFMGLLLDGFDAGGGGSGSAYAFA